MFSFLVAQPGAGFLLESSTSDEASMEVALETGRAKLALFSDTILVGCVFPFETERRYWIVELWQASVNKWNRER